MNFNHPTMANGEANLHRWESECGRYAISVYAFKKGEACDAYYVGYRRHDGKCLTDDHANIIHCARELRHHHEATL